jgi:hypothetical protein
MCILLLLNLKLLFKYKRIFSHLKSSVVSLSNQYTLWTQPRTILKVYNNDYLLLKSRAVETCACTADVIASLWPILGVPDEFLRRDNSLWNDLSRYHGLVQAMHWRRYRFFTSTERFGECRTMSMLLPPDCPVIVTWKSRCLHLFIMCLSHLIAICLLYMSIIWPWFVTWSPFIFHVHVCTFLHFAHGLHRNNTWYFTT